MYNELLKHYIGRVIKIEIGHQFRSAAEVLAGCVAGLYAEDKVMAFIIYRPNDRPLALPQAAVKPDMKPQTVAQAQTQLQSVPGQPANAVLPGAPLPNMTPQAVPAPQAPQASQSNVQERLIETWWDIHVRWITIAQVIHVEADSGVRAELTNNKINASVEPERMFDAMPEFIMKPNGTKMKMTPEIKKHWHEYVFADVRTRLRELGYEPSTWDPPAVIKTQPVQEEAPAAAGD